MPWCRRSGPAISSEAEAREAERHHRPGRRLRHGANSATAADIVCVDRYGRGQGYGSAAPNVCAVVERNAGLRHNRPGENGGGSKGRGAADLPKDVVAVAAVDKINGGGAGRRQRAANLKDEGRVRVALSVQGQRSCESRRRGEEVNARRKGKAAEILSAQVVRVGGSSPAATLYAVSDRRPAIARRGDRRDWSGVYRPKRAYRTGRLGQFPGSQRRIQIGLHYPLRSQRSLHPSSSLDTRDMDEALRTRARTGIARE